jgi:hypothetical protein
MIRLVNRILVLVLGAALAAAGLVVILEGVATWTNSGFVWIPGKQWLAAFKTTQWSAPIVVGISIGVAAAGFLLFVMQVRPQPKRVVPYRTDSDAQWLLLRRSTEAHLQRRLSAHVPTSPIKARIKARSSRWSLIVHARAASTTRPILETAARSELASLHPPGTPRIRVRTTGARKSPTNKP